MLAQRHHTGRDEEEIRREAANLARMFRLPGLPLWAPDRVRRQDLRKAGCIRAFLGRPQLILLENPTLGVYADIIAPLVNAVNPARRAGRRWSGRRRRGGCGMIPACVRRAGARYSAPRCTR